MKNRPLTYLIPILLMLILAPFLSAQNLLENKELQRSRQLQIDSQRALNSGDYERAAELARESERLAVEGKEKAVEQARAYRANTLLNRAKNRIDYVRLIGAADRLADRYRKAQQLYAESRTALGSREYDRSMELSRSVLSELEGITPQRLARDEKVLPRFYEVRFIPERRDCFWRIAEYDFIYGDPFEWERIYEANKSKLNDQDNPGLIEPGMVFEIPSLEGERREGTWKE
jgi:nucleoid-associated protein YgaU